MSVLTCPRCRSEVQAVEGRTPVCPACGLGARDAPEPPVRGAAPVPPAGPVPRVASASGRWKVPVLVVAAVVVVAAVAAALVMVGGGGGPEALGQEEAEEVAALAMAGLVEDMGSQDGGDLRSLTGSFSFEDGDFGSGTATFEMEWGRGDAGRFLMGIRSGGVTLTLEGFCFPDRNVLVFGEEVHESRPDADDGPCMDALTGDAPLDGMSLFNFTREFPDMEVTPNDDGTVTATFSDEEGDYTLHVDARGRATRLEVDSPEGSGAFDADYGARVTLTAPEATGRLPSSVGGFCFLSGGTCTFTAYDGDDAPLSDFEVRVYAVGATPDDDPDAQPVATFPLDGGEQSAGGFALSVSDDGDGRFGEGDTFQVRAPGDDYEVVVWDLWADHDILYNPTPGPALAWVALALVGAAVLRRR